MTEYGNIPQTRERPMSEAMQELMGEYDVAVHLPAIISREFLSAALLHMAENKVDFGLFHDGRKIVIAYFGGYDDFVPQRWSDRKWHIGTDPNLMDEVLRDD